MKLGGTSRIKSKLKFWGKNGGDELKHANHTRRGRPYTKAQKEGGLLAARSKCKGGNGTSNREVNLQGKEDWGVEEARIRRSFGGGQVSNSRRKGEGGPRSARLWEIQGQTMRTRGKKNVGGA